MTLNLNVPKGTRHKRMIVKMAQHLNDIGPRNSRQILEHLNNTTRHGSSMNEMGNVLSKNPKWFQKVGTDEVDAEISGHYYIIVWDLSAQQKRANKGGDGADV